VGDAWRDPAVRAAEFRAAVGLHLDDWSAVAGAVAGDAGMARAAVLDAAASAWERAVDLPARDDLVADLERRILAECRRRLRSLRPIIGAPVTLSPAPGGSEDLDAAGRAAIERAATAIRLLDADHAIAIALRGMGLDDAAIAGRMDLGVVAARSLVAGGFESVERGVATGGIEAAGGMDAVVRAAVSRLAMPATPDLREHLVRIPDEIRPLRRRAVRRLVTAAPWVAVVVVAVGLVLLPTLAWAVAAALGGGPQGAWDPNDPGRSEAGLGLLATPMPALLAVAAAGVAVRAVGRRVAGVRPSIERRGVGDELRRAATVVLVAVVLQLVAASAGVGLLSPHDAVVAVAASAPGPMAPEVGAGDNWVDEVEGTYWREAPIPRWTFLVRPGEGFRYVVRARNGSLVPITILGVPEHRFTLDERLDGTASTRTSLGLLRDPAVVSSDPADVVPFHPVLLLPGQEVAIVVARMGGSCADPEAAVDPPTGVGGSVERGAPGMAIVFDVLGWRVDGDFWPPVDVVVPTTPGCEH
jgi:DNA-directed RNA polymerase specialized sigma24 family protein